MAYRLAPSISFTRIDDALIFLDVERDRYFRLPLTIEQALLCRIADASSDARCSPSSANRACPQSPELDRAVELGVLVIAEDAQDDPIDWLSDKFIAVPTESALEAYHGEAPKVVDFLFVTLALAIASRRLKLLRFAAAIANDHRRRVPRSRHDHADIAPLAQRFERVRRTLPFSNQCLRDSIALRLWLAGHGHVATLTLGVASAPFAAHCWLQTEHQILNETSDGVRRFTPILAIS